VLQAFGANPAGNGVSTDSTSNTQGDHGQL
jgi:hypothetical protein